MKQHRMTRQKQLILDVTNKHYDHPTADQIYIEVRNVDNKISRGTVYRNLVQLSQSGKMTHVKVPGADRFDRRLDYHYHMICTSCGAVFDAPIIYQQNFDKEILKQTDFKVERHRIFFEGLCKDCENS